MEVTAAERTTIYTNISPLAQRVNNYIQTQHSSIAAVAKDIGYGGTPEERDATAILLTLPMGLVALFTEIPERGKRTKRDYRA